MKAQIAGRPWRIIPGNEQDGMFTVHADATKKHDALTADMALSCSLTHADKMQALCLLPGFMKTNKFIMSSASPQPSSASSQEDGSDATAACGASAAAAAACSGSHA